MADISYKITFDFGAVYDITKAINAEMAPLLHQAVRAIAEQTAINWKKEVYAAKLWSGEKDAYAKSISWRMEGDFTAVVESNYKWDKEIETGRPARDLKKMLDTSLKVRRSAKSGKRFLVIPLRHNTPGNNAHAKAMPPDIYKLVEAMTASRIVGEGKRPSGQITHLSPKTGMHPAAKQTPFLSDPKTKGAFLVPKRDYNWGDRLTNQMLREAGLNTRENKHFKGMVRFDTSTPGGGKSSAYYTFRIMMDGQNGWIIPAQPGKYILKKVVDEMQPKAEKAFQAAISKTFNPKK